MIKSSEGTGALAIAIGRRPWIAAAGRVVAALLLVLAAGGVLDLILARGAGRINPAGIVVLCLLGAGLGTLTRAATRLTAFAAATTLALGIAFLIAQAVGVRLAGQDVSVAASVVMVVAGLVLTVLALDLGRDIEKILLGVGGIVLVSLSVTMVVGTTVGVFDVASQREIAGAAIEIWVAGILVGSFFLVVVLSNDLPSTEAPHWMPAGVGIASLLVVIILWLALVARERGQAVAQTRLAVEAERLALLRQLEAASRAVQRTAYWAAGDVSPGDFATRFDALVRGTPGMVGGAWFAPNAPMVMAATDDSLVYQAAWARVMAETIRSERVQYFRLAERQQQVAVVVPVCEGGRCDQGLVGILDIPTLFGATLADTAAGFHFAVTERGAGIPTEDGWIQTTPMGLGEIGWIISATPTLSARERLRSNLPATVLFMGLFVGGLLPITLRMGQVARLRTREGVQARLAAALDRATDGVWELDVVRLVASRSGALWRYLRYEAVPDSSGDPWFSLIHPDDRPRVDRELERHLAGQADRFEVEYRLKAGDGSWHTIVDRGRVVDRSATGRPLRMLGISADVTESTAAALSLTESENRFRAIFDSAFQLQLLLDLDGRVLAVNRAALRSASSTTEPVVGRFCWDTLWWTEEPRAAARIREAIMLAKDGDQRGYTEEFGSRASGLIVEFCLTPVRDALGRPSQLLLEGRDDSERRRAEYALQEVSTLTTMGRIAARVAHEINNPLAGIQNSFLLIKDAISPDHPHAAYVGMIEREIGRIAAVTRQLYETYRPESESTQKASVGTVVGDAVALLTQLNKRTGVHFEVDVGGVPPVVALPSVMLRQIVFNLLQNAVDASPTDGVVSITATQGDGILMIRVRDQGPGIPAELREKIFEPFFSTKEREIRTGGMGLGLSLVHRSVTAVSGRISVGEAPGGGAEFVVALPIKANEGEK